MAPVKKKSAKKRKLAVPGKKRAGKRWTKAEWVCIGGDISMSSISLGGIALTAGGKIRAGAISKRWTKDIDYFIRLKDAARAHDLVDELLAELKTMAGLEQISFGIEEAVPIGMLQRGSKGGSGSWMKQQLQISGAFLGGLVKYGYQDIVEIQANQWRSMIAHELGITIHPTKWNAETELPLPEEFPPVGVKNVGKYRAQQWVVSFHPKWDKGWPDIISSSDGQVPRPENSLAAGQQSDDRYEALAMAEWLRRELRKTDHA